MVSRDDLINAIALHSSMFNASRVIGTAVAGLLVAWIGEGWCFFVNGASYIAVIIGLLFISGVAHKPVEHPGSPLADVIAGFRFVLRSAPIHQLLILLGVGALCGALLLPSGFAMMVEMGSSNTLIQSMSPDHLRGRVMPVYSMMFMGMDRRGAPATVAAAGVICMLGAAAFGFRLPGLRAEGRRLIAAAELAGGER